MAAPARTFPRRVTPSLLGGCAILIAGILCVTDQVTAQYGYHFGRNKVQYEDFDWHVLKTDHFDIYYYPEMQELAEHGAHFAEEAYNELVNRFNLSLNNRVPIIFYSSNLHFRQTNVIPQFIPDGVGGFFEFIKGRVVVPANGNLHRFRRVIRHEMVHVFTHAKVATILRDYRQPPDRYLPLWFTEGIAEHWSGEPDHQYEMLMRDAVFSNYLVPLEDINRIAGSYLMYKQGEAICRFISRQYGDEYLLLLMENFWIDKDFRRVLEVTLREEFSEIGRKWSAWIYDQYFRELGDVEVPSLIAEGVAGRGFNAKPAFYRHTDGRRKIYYVANQTGYTNLYQVEVDSLYKPKSRPEILIRGERTEAFESLSLFEGRMSVSRDGKMAFVTQRGGSEVIHVYDLERDELVSSYDFADLITVNSPTWDPEGRHVAFASIDRRGFSNLFTFDLEDGVLRRLTDDAYDDRYPSWSPDGKSIAFSSDRTQHGKLDAYNIFLYHLGDDRIEYVTEGRRQDMSPSWSPDASYLLFTSARRDSTGRYGPHDLWVADMRPPTPESIVASASISLSGPSTVPQVQKQRLHRLTNFTGAAMDPIWTEDGRVVFTSFEHHRFSVRQISDIDERIESPRETEVIRFAPRVETAWKFGRISAETAGAERRPYRRRYDLDIAHGQVSQNPLWGTSGGAFLSFSDMLGDDRWFVTVYNTAGSQRDFLRSLNLAVSRLQLHRRTNIAYGAYRFAGYRYDIRDPDAAASFPVFWETMYGGFGAVGYPISQFRRIEVNTSLNWSDKDVYVRNLRRKSLLLSNMVSLVHDNALYGMNGPVEGWRGNLTAAYTTDLVHSHVNYFTLSLDVRHYLRLSRTMTFASWGMGRINEGREARLFILGGSWDLRGYPLFSIRGRKMWFTSHEFRFPIADAPGAYIPVLAPFGVANFRGALFFDAAHAWNDGYRIRDPQLGTGQTLGATGLGFRMNLFGGLVLRYDLGYRFWDDFNRRQWFRQFFFGWDF